MRSGRNEEKGPSVELATGKPHSWESFLLLAIQKCIPLSRRRHSKKCIEGRFIESLENGNTCCCILKKLEPAGTCSWLLVTGLIMFLFFWKQCDAKDHLLNKTSSFLAEIHDPFARALDPVHFRKHAHQPSFRFRGLRKEWKRFVTWSEIMNGKIFRSKIYWDLIMVPLDTRCY